MYTSISKMTEESKSSTSNQSKIWLYKLLFHLNTLWLFTRNDLNSMIYPNIILSVVCGVSKTDLASGHSTDLTYTVSNIPYVFAWLWLNLLLFNLANQRLPSSIVEDSINKPWRPIPSGRINANQASIILLILMPLVLLVSVALSTATQALALMALTWAYNDLAGADMSFVTRNLLNAFGMSMFSAGAIIIARGSQLGLTEATTQWVAFIGLVEATTVHVQDMKDQEGDAMRERQTLPLAMGDGFARWTIAVFVMGWSLAAPTFWRVSMQGYLPTAAIGAIITFRILCLRSVEADKNTWTCWCVWMVALYLLPLWLNFSSGFQN